MSVISTVMVSLMNGKGAHHDRLCGRVERGFNGPEWWSSFPMFEDMFCGPLRSILTRMHGCGWGHVSGACRQDLGCVDGSWDVRKEAGKGGLGQSMPLHVWRGRNTRQGAGAHEWGLGHMK